MISMYHILYNITHQNKRAAYCLQQDPPSRQNSKCLQINTHITGKMESDKRATGLC